MEKMDPELKRLFESRGLSTDLKDGPLPQDRELAVAQRCFKMLQDFSMSSSKLGVVDFFSKHMDRFFKGTKAQQEEELATFLGALLFRKTPEMAMYADIFAHNVQGKSAKLFARAFLDVQAQNPSLYENKQKLLRTIRLDPKKALLQGAQIVKDDPAALHFNKAFSAKTEAAKGSQGITADLLVAAVVAASLEGGGTEEKITLNWNSNDPRTFEVQVVLPKPQKKEEVIKIEEPRPKKKEEKLNKICHDYLWEKGDGAAAEPAEEEDLDKQIIQLRAKLERQKIEFEMQKNLYKLIINNSKTSVKHYKELRTELQAVEELLDVTMNGLDKNTDDWRRLFMLKSNEVERLRKYKFLLATVLQNCMNDMQRDFKTLSHSAEGVDTQSRERPATLGDYLAALAKYGLPTEFHDLIKQEEAPKEPAAQAKEEPTLEDEKESAKKNQMVSSSLAAKNGTLPEKPAAKKPIGKKPKPVAKKGIESKLDMKPENPLEKAQKSGTEAKAKEKTPKKIQDRSTSRKPVKQKA